MIYLSRVVMLRIVSCYTFDRVMARPHFKLLFKPLYNTINFLQNTHKRHSIARPRGRGMECICEFILESINCACHCHFMFYAALWLTGGYRPYGRYPPDTPVCHYTRGYVPLRPATHALRTCVGHVACWNRLLVAAYLRPSWDTNVLKWASS